jgi:hypothetical protein
MSTKILIHKFVHLDEILAVILLRRYGEAKFPGVSRAEVLLVSDDPKGDDVFYDAEGVIPVGCGGGRFNEHRPSSGRIAQQCAATLVADYLGIRDKPGIKELLAEVLRCDTQSGVHNFQMAELLKTSNRCLPGGERATIRFAEEAIPIILQQLTYSLAARNGTERGIGDLLEEWLGKNTVDAKIQAYLRRLAKESAEQRQITGLDFIVRAMQRQGKPLKEVREWVDFAFGRLVQDQTEFFRMVEEIRPDQTTGPGGCSREYRMGMTSDGRRFREVKVLVVNSDDRWAGRAALYLHYPIHIIRKSNGQTQIFCNKGSGLGPDEVGDIVAHLRFWEVEGDTKLTWMELREPGRVERSPAWYYFAEAGQIFNGSNSHPDVPATKLSIDAIIAAVRRALNFPALQRWQKEQGIKIKAEKPGPPPWHSEMRELEDALDQK